MKRPNIVLIMSDQQRLDSVSAYGKGICKTHHIDTLAKDGMIFTHAYTPSAICAPARASLFTGLYPHNHGVVGNDASLQKDQTTLSDYVENAGYRSGYVGKWHVTHEKGPSEYGFQAKDFMGYGYPGSGVFQNLKFNLPPQNSPNYYEEYLQDQGFATPDISHGFMGTNPTNQEQEMYARHDGSVESTVEAFIAREAEQLIEQFSNKDEPFFLWTNFWGPHSPSIVPEPYYSMYDPSDIQEHPSYKETFQNKPYSHKLMEKFWGLSEYGWDGFADITAKYFGHCSLIDDMVGRIIQKLKDQNLFDNTIIIYTTDHGDCMGAHKLIEKGSFMYDEIYHVPLIIHGLEKGVSEEFVYLHDLMPTIVELMGETLKGKIDSKSLYPLLHRGTWESRESVFCEFEKHFYSSHQRMVRDREYQFTFNPSEICELYDLKKDPYQLHNEIDNKEYAYIKEIYKDKLYSHMVNTQDPQAPWFSRVRGIL